MLVYGDLERDENAAVVGAEVDQRLRRCAGLDAGLERHQALVAAFVRASELVQGVLDGEFARVGRDDVGDLQAAGTGLLRVLADAIEASWDSGFADYACGAWDEPLALLSMAGTIRTKQAEGYAFYALYPEAYLLAARQSGLGPGTTVIGIRSIGAGLAAMVATGLRASAAYTVRPIGQPFDRQLALTDRLAAQLCAGTGDFAIVDEGPGLSGSSFNCVADWLVAHGIAEQRIHFFPSHGGELGSAARAEHRQRWSAAQKHVVAFEKLLLGARPRLRDWLSDVVGPVEGGLEDLSGGAWRALKTSSPPRPVAADPAMERRKYRVKSQTGVWLAKFAGVGPAGEARLALAEKLAMAGFAPKPVALLHGFLVLPWVTEDANAGETVPLERLADYLVLRAGLPPQDGGADLEQLFAMAIYNIGEALGEGAAASARAKLGEAARFERVPCCTDNRLHAWEWIRSGGTWFKLDGLDHHAAHDLVGCQDIAWDLAGAAVELALGDVEQNQLVQSVAERIGRDITADFVAAYTLCYLGFQIGLWSMARDRAGTDDREAIEARLRRYLTHPALAELAAR